MPHSKLNWYIVISFPTGLIFHFQPPLILSIYILSLLKYFNFFIIFQRLNFFLFTETWRKASAATRVRIRLAYTAWIPSAFLPASSVKLGSLLWIPVLRPSGSWDAIGKTLFHHCYFKFKLFFYTLNFNWIVPYSWNFHYKKPGKPC